MKNTIVVLGPAGTNGHEAAERMKKIAFPGPAEVEIVFVPRNQDVLSKVAFDKQVGVVPIESAAAGYVSEVVQFWSSNSGREIRVIGEIELPVQHNLLVYETITSSTEIEAIASHPQALSQCAKNLASLGWSDLRPTTSTAKAAELVANDESYRNVGALASPFAGRIYGLKTLRTNLEDYPSNATRFHLIAPAKSPLAETEPTGQDRTAIMFTIKNEPSSLKKALDCIVVNMSTMHSIPMGVPGKFSFYCEFESHGQDVLGKKILRDLSLATDQVLFLGSYPITVGRRV